MAVAVWVWTNPCETTEEQKFAHVRRPTTCVAPRRRCPRCSIVNAARCIATYTFRWVLNYILNLDELFHLADKRVGLLCSGRAGGVGNPRRNSPNRQSECPMCPATITSECPEGRKMNRHLFNQAHPRKQLIRLAGIQSHRLFGDTGAISCVNFGIYSAALGARRPLVIVNSLLYRPGSPRLCANTHNRCK